MTWDPDDEYQLGLPFDGPDFDGATYRRDRDRARLGAQLVRVMDALSDGGWWTLSALHARTGDPEASISARLRDLRKGKFGGYTVTAENLGRGTWRYRLERKDPPAPVAALPGFGI